MTRKQPCSRLGAGDVDPGNRSISRRQERASIEDPSPVLAAALRFLEVRARSIDEVQRRLTRAGYPPGLIDDVLSRLVGLGMLDDEAFAKAWVESRDRQRPRGERALRAELRAKAVDAGVIERVLDERRRADPGIRADAFGSGDGGSGGDRAVDPGSGDIDAAGARRLLARQERSLLRVADPRRRRDRAWALLARAGFDSDTVREVVLEAQRRWEMEAPAEDSGA